MCLRLKKKQTKKREIRNESTSNLNSVLKWINLILIDNRFTFQDTLLRMHTTNELIEQVVI